MEGGRAKKSNGDNVLFDPSCSFRGEAYRLLHHQGGIMGHLHVRIVEARHLQNSPGLQGDGDGVVSSYGVFQCTSTPNNCDNDEADDVDSNDDDCMAWSRSSMNKLQDAITRDVGEDTPPPSWLASLDSLHVHDADLGEGDKKPAAQTNQNSKNGKCYSSGVVPHDNHPTWTGAASSSFILPLHKTAYPEGHDVLLKVTMMDAGGQHRDYANVDTLGLYRNYMHHANTTTKYTHGLLGHASVNLHPLLYGTLGVMDVWLTLSSDIKNQKASTTNDTTPKARVRLLLSYEPHGMPPQPGDVVCLEPFARSPHNLLMPNLHCNPAPLKVLQVRGPFLLVRYRISSHNHNHNHNSAFHGTLRLHRNTLFVMERITPMDAAWNAALTPLDIATQLPPVQLAGQVASPYMKRMTEVAMPVVLSVQLAWGAARATGAAGMTGVMTAGRVLWSGFMAAQHGQE